MKNAKYLKVVNDGLIKHNEEMFKNGNIIEIREIDYNENRIDVWNKGKFLSELMYEDEWRAFEIIK